MIEHLFIEAPWWQVYLATVAYFTILYFSLALLGDYLASSFLPRHHIGRPVTEKKADAQQKRAEIRASLISICVFGFFGILPKLFYTWGLVSIRWNINWKILPFELLFIFFWNDLHFYFCHRLLHRKWFFKRVHIIHHHSHTPTAFSTYSFHWFEAFLLSTVMIIPMFFYNFTYITLLFLPFMSLFLNMLGHWNYDLFPNRKKGIYKFSTHHSLHHSKVNGNYGFFLSIFDQWFETELPAAEISKK